MAGAAGMRLFSPQRQDLSCILNHIVKSRHFDLFISLSQSIFWGAEVVVVVVVEWIR